MLLLAIPLKAKTHKMEQDLIACEVEQVVEPFCKLKTVRLDHSKIYEILQALFCRHHV